jgi:hypothetical protein
MPDLQIQEHEHYREAIDSVRKRVPVPRAVWDTMQAEERDHAFTVSQVARTQVLQQVLDAIDKAVTTGTAITDFRDEVADKLIDQWGGEIPGRIETIFRTNIAAAYAEGRHAINSAPAVKEARPYWRFDDTDNDRECDLCHDCHGVILPSDHPWWNTHHTPLHHQCECQVTALTPEEAADEGLTETPPDVDADDGFGRQPSSDGKDWAPDLSDIDPELRRALEQKLDELQSRGGAPAPRTRAEEHEDLPRRRSEPEPVEVPEPELAPREKIVNEIEAFEERHAERKTETAIVIDERGESVLSKPGSRRSVRFTADELRSMKDAHVVHNHPAGPYGCGPSLSPADLNLAVSNNTASVTAITKDHFTGVIKNYSFNRPAAGWPSVSQIAQAKAAAVKEALEHLRIAVKYRAISEEDAVVSYFHEVWTRVQKRIDLGYRHTERPGGKR